MVRVLFILLHSLYHAVGAYVYHYALGLQVLFSTVDHLCTRHVLQTVVFGRLELGITALDNLVVDIVRVLNGWANLFGG